MGDGISYVVADGILYAVGDVILCTVEDGIFRNSMLMFFMS